MAHHKISLCFYQGGEVDDHDAVDHSHKRNNTVKVKVIKRKCMNMRATRERVL